MTRRTLIGARRMRFCVSFMLLASACSQPAHADKVRISNLADVNFGLVSNLQADSRRSQNVCLYSNGTNGGYSVTASGSGPASTFALTNGAHQLAYEVEWSPQSGQTTGAELTLRKRTYSCTGRGTDMEDYNYCIEMARYYREMAENLDGHQRMAVMEVVRKWEMKARSLARGIEQAKRKPGEA